MVPKRYNQFEALHKALGEKYPATILPDLPKKLLMMKDSTQSERRIAFDKLMKAIAQNPKICFSSIVLTFLGLTEEQIKTAENRNRTPSKQSKEINGENKKQSTNEQKIEKREEVNLFGDLDDEEDNLFGGTSKTSKPKIESSEGNELTKDEESAEDNELFRLMRAADPKPEKPKQEKPKPNASVSMFADPDLEDGNIFLAVDTTDRPPSHDLTSAYEDNSELLNIDDDIDNLFLSVEKKKVETKVPEDVPSKEIPEVTIKPVLKNKPTVLSKPIVANKPSVATKPKLATKPNIAGKPTVASKPNLASKPSVASKPNIASKPKLVNKPATEPVVPTEPVLSTEPVVPTEPVASSEPAVEAGMSVKPATDESNLNSNEPKSTEKPEATSGISNTTNKLKVSKYDDLFAEPTDTDSNLDNDDIMAYILNNSGREEASLDLF
ncbi:uncharacterized protein [Antedon mediterranea]